MERKGKKEREKGKGKGWERVGKGLGGLKEGCVKIVKDDGRVRRYEGRYGV